MTRKEIVIKNHKATVSDKVNWILEHWKMCELYPNSHMFKHPRHKNIVDAMKRSGLYSKSTYYPDIKLFEYIEMAREIKKNEVK